MDVLLAVVLFFHGAIAAKGPSWPDGTYGLPQPVSGCPDGHGVQWKTGWRRQHLEISQNNISYPSHLNASLLRNRAGIERSFCIKTVEKTGDSNTSWPAGTYCFYKYGKSCPEGMKNGSIHWDDINENNSNGHGGTLPEGNYDDDTTIQYCCREDGDLNEPIDLPIDKPFYLLSYKIALCQHVKWTVCSIESIKFDTEDDNNTDQFQGNHPHASKSNSVLTAFYCYYKACKSTLQTITGSFSIYDSNHQYCSWTIALKSNLLISLTFSLLQIPDCKMNYLDVYEGVNDQGTLVKRFCGSNATKAVSMNSTSNTLFVMLKSGGNFEGIQTKYVKFEAEYESIVNSKRCHELLTPGVNDGSFTSPMFPYQSYPPNQNCSWRITTEKSHFISLTFAQIHFPDSEENCIYIYNGPNTTSALLVSICNEERATNWTGNSTGNSLYIVYTSGAYSDVHLRKPIGFRAKYRIFKPFSIGTNYPTDYPNQVEPPKTYTTKLLQSQNKSSSKLVIIIVTTSLVSFLLLVSLTIGIFLLRRFACSPMSRMLPKNKVRKESENPIYEQSTSHFGRSDNPLYSSSSDTAYEQVHIENVFLTKASDDLKNKNKKKNKNNVVERQYEEPII